MDRVKRIWYLSPVRAAKVQASLRDTSSESRGFFGQKASSLAPLNGWACAVEICHNGMLEDTNSLDGAHIVSLKTYFIALFIAPWGRPQVLTTLVTARPLHCNLHSTK